MENEADKQRYLPIVEQAGMTFTDAFHVFLQQSLNAASLLFMLLKSKKVEIINSFAITNRKTI